MLGARFSNVPETSKSHFKNHEVFYVQSFLCQLTLMSAYTYEAFRIWFFSYGLLNLAFQARKRSGTFEKRKQFAITMSIDSNLSSVAISKTFLQIRSSHRCTTPNFVFLFSCLFEWKNHSKLETSVFESFAVANLPYQPRG